MYIRLLFCFSIKCIIYDYKNRLYCVLYYFRLVFFFVYVKGKFYYFDVWIMCFFYDLVFYCFFFYFVGQGVIIKIIIFMYDKLMEIEYLK